MSSTWVKILTENDSVNSDNLSSANLEQADATRNYDLIADGTLNFRTSSDATILTMSQDTDGSATEVGVQGLLNVKKDGDNRAEIRLQETGTGTNYIALQAPSSLTSNYTLTLPTSDGNAGQQLTTDGSGNLTWGSAGALSGTGVSGRVTFWNGTTALSSDDTFTWNATSNTLTVKGPLYTNEVVIEDYNSTTLNAAGRHGYGSTVIDNLGSTVVAAGRMYALSETGGTTTWIDSDADTEANATGLLAIATATNSRDGMLLKGAVRVSSNSDFSSANAGDKLYVSASATRITSTAPTGSGQYVRLVGYAIDASNGIIFFDPSSDYIELS